MTDEDIVKKINEDETLRENLDGLIHEYHSQRASSINNEGVAAQLDWICEEVGDKAEEVLKQLQN